MSVEYYCPRKDGSVLVSASDDKTRVLCMYDAGGMLLSQSIPMEIKESFGYTVLVTAGDTILYGSVGGNVWLYDSTLTLLCEDRLQTTAEYAVRNAENVFTVICENGTSYTYDTAAGAFSECTLYEETALSRSANDILHTSDGVFFTDHDAVTAVWDGTPTQILNWEASGYRMTDVEFVQAVGRDSFLVRYDDRLRGETYPALLVHKEPERVIVPEPIRVAMVGMQVFGQRDPRVILQESVLAFNRENPYYCIELTDYDAVYYGEPGSPIPTAGRADTRFDTFARDLTAGKTYDVYLFGSEYDGAAALEEKNLFADVRRLCERTDYITALQSAWSTQEDVVYRIPMSMTASALVTPSDTLNLFLCHLPSRRGGERQSRPFRLLAAQALRHAIDSVHQANPQANVVVMGDFNDNLTDTRVAQAMGVVPSSLASSHLTPGLVSLIAGKQPGTYAYQGRWEVIDHLLVSPSLLNPTASLSTRPSLARIATLPFLLTTDTKFGIPIPHRTYQGPRYLGGFSDHLPIVVDFAKRCE